MQGLEPVGSVSSFVSSAKRHFVCAPAAATCWWYTGVSVVAFLCSPLTGHGQVPRAGTSGPAVRGAAAPTRSPQAAAPTRPATKGGAAPAVATTPAGAPGARQPAAVVNSEPIMPEQLANEALRRFGKEVLESIINKQLIWQECQKHQVQISEQDVEDEIERMAAKFGLSRERWLTMLRDERGLSPDQYRREIIWPTIAMRRLAAAQTEVTDEELRQAFESEHGPQVRVRMIALFDAATAQKVHQEATAQPEKFPDLAKQYSRDPNSAASRGIIPPIRKHVGDPELERVAFGLKEGEISPVIHVANQFLILRCEQHIKESLVASQDLPREEQRLRDTIRDNKLRNAAAAMFQRLQADAQVVNVLNDPEKSRQFPGVAATINGAPITMKQLADDCVARHGKDVLEGEINRKLLEQELRRMNRQVTQEAVDEEIVRAADTYGFHRPDGQPDVDGWLKSVTETEKLSVELYIRDMVWPSVALKTIVGQKVQVTQDDLQKGFESNYGERVEVLAVVLSNQRQANQVWELARSNPSDQFFAELATQYSVEPVSRSNQGKVPPIRKFGGQPLLEEEAFKLQPGEQSGIVAIGDKFVILRCLGRTRPVVTEFAAVKDELYKDIQEKKLRLAMAQEFDRLRESAQIDNFLANSSQSGKRAGDRAGAVAPASARQVVPAGPRTAGPLPAASASAAPSGAATAGPRGAGTAPRTATLPQGTVPQGTVPRSAPRR